MSDMSPEDQAAADMLSRHSGRAEQLVQELVNAAQANDWRRGGELCRELHRTPELLMLVVGMMTTAIVKLATGATGPLATPEQLGMPADRKPEAWQVGVLDQMQAAAGEKDINAFAAIAVDAEMRAYLMDIRAQGARGEDLPDTETLMRAFMVMDRVTLTAVAAEQLRRLLRAEVEKDGR